MKALINRINRRLANRASIWLLFLTCVFAVGVNAEPKIVGETVIKGFSARMSTDEFIRVSQSYNPRGNPKPNVFVFVDCYKTWAQWNIELHTDLGLEPTDEDLAKWREEGCYELAAGASNLTIGGIPIKSVSQYQAKPDEQVESVYDLVSKIGFSFDGRNHAKMADILRSKFGEPYWISDPDNPTTSWFSWSLASDDMTNMDEWERTTGVSLHLSGVDNFSVLALEHKDLERVWDFERRQLDDF